MHSTIARVRGAMSPASSAMSYDCNRIHFNLEKATNLIQFNIELKEPIRREVLTFKFSPDRAVKRDIRMILLDKKKPQSYEVEVSLNKNEITKIKPLENVQPALMGSEYVHTWITNFLDRMCSHLRITLLESIIFDISRL